MLTANRSSSGMTPVTTALKRSAPESTSLDDAPSAKRLAWSSPQQQTSKLVAPFTDMAGNTIVSGSVAVLADKENAVCQVATASSTASSANAAAVATRNSIVAAIPKETPKFVHSTASAVRPKNKPMDDELPPLASLDTAGGVEAAAAAAATTLSAGEAGGHATPRKAALKRIQVPPNLHIDDNSQDEATMERLARKFDCDAIRRKIQRFLAGKTVTQTAFLKEMNVNSNSFRRFMQLKGAFSGSQNGTYWGALRYFHNHEVKEKASAPRSSTASSKEAKARAKAEANELLAKVASVDLPEPVYVFDDCDEIRKRINEVIASKRLTQAALLRELQVNSNSLRRFLSSKGKREGCSNGVYLKAYCFFERLRIAEGRPKSKKRLTKEAELPMGYPLKRDPTHFVVSSRVPFDGRALKKSLEEGTYWYRVAEAMEKSP